MNTAPGALFTAINFLQNLRMGAISLSVKLHLPGTDTLADWAILSYEENEVLQINQGIKSLFVLCFCFYHGHALKYSG